MYYKPKKITRTSITRNTSYAGETIENKVRRITTNGEPISDGAPLIYRNRERGVEPEFNIRHDRMETAIEVADVITKTRLAKRQERLDARIPKKDEKPTENKGEGKA